MKNLKKILFIILIFTSNLILKSQDISESEIKKIHEMIVNRDTAVQQVIDSYLNQDTCNVTFLYYKALYFDSQNQLELAKYYYFKVINLDSTIFNAYYNLGTLFYNQGIKSYHSEPISIQKYDLWNAERTNYFYIAKLFFDKAKLINPNDANLINIYQVLDKRINCKRVLNVF